MRQAALSSMIVVALAGTAMGDVSTINGFFEQNRFVNEFPGSSLTVTDSGLPGGIRYQEQFPTNLPAGFANQHRATFSSDGGTTPYSFVGNESWRLDFDFNMRTNGTSTPGGNKNPRREAGLLFNSFFSGTDGGGNPITPGLFEGYMIITSDGEIAMFAGGLPFFSSNVGSSTLTPISPYVLGTTFHFGVEYYAPGTAGTNGKLRILVTDNNSVTGDTGLLDLAGFGGTSFPGFGDGSQLGFRTQAQRNPGISDGYDANYSNVKFIPTPASASILGLGGLLATRRRR